ncbi:MAG: carboxymuconolactone decarboxylase family protein [Acidobacteriota bacterium]|nr:carboxymuconolactone decarboxylase family protein [Acidobacteriota bacterium]
MASIAPLRREDLPELEPVFAAVEGVMGFVPNSFLTMARRPEMLRAFSAFARTVLGPGRIEPQLKHLISLTASNAAGCRYCQAHTSHSASHAGNDGEKIRGVWDFETSDLFDGRERAALRLARDAALVPNQTTPSHFAALAEHFDDDEVVEIVGIVSLFGYLNRWNDTMATELEPRPLDFAGDTLGSRGWEVAKHRPA